MNSFLDFYTKRIFTKSQTESVLIQSYIIYVPKRRCFYNAGTSVHRVDCDNTDVRYNGCPYLEFLEKQDYTGYRVTHIGRITIVELNFWMNYSAKEKNLPYPKTFCALCPYNRGR